MGKSLLASTVERMERYEREGRRCRMNGDCSHRATLRVTCEDHGVHTWTFCERHGLAFIASAEYFGRTNNANPDSHLISTERF